MNVYYVYEWYIKETGQVFYVGKGKGRRYQACGHKTFGFRYMISHYDCDVRIVSQNLSEQDAFNEEIKRIAYYRSISDSILVNITNGGEGTSGYVCTSEMKDHLSAAMKSKWKIDEEFRSRMMAIRNDPNGPYKSNDFKNKISLLVSGEKNPNYGNRWTQDMKNNLAEKRKSDPRYKDSNNPNAKSVVCLETNEFFSCIKQAMDKYKIKTNGSISVCLDEPQRTAAGLHWIESPEPLSNEECFEKYLQILALENGKNPVVCCETKELFLKQKDFIKFINPYSTTRNTKEKLKSGRLVVNGKTYMYVKDYLQSHMTETS